jgi:hypothetical protein
MQGIATYKPTMVRVASRGLKPQQLEQQTQRSVTCQNMTPLVPVRG